MKRLYLFILLLIISILGNAIMLNSSVLEVGEYSYKSVGSFSSVTYGREENADVINSVKFWKGNVLIEEKINRRVDSNSFGIYFVYNNTVYTKHTNDYGQDYYYKIHNIFSIEDKEGNIYKNTMATVIQILLGVADVIFVILIFVCLKKRKTNK